MSGRPGVVASRCSAHSTAASARIYGKHKKPDFREVTVRKIIGQKLQLTVNSEKKIKSHEDKSGKEKKQENSDYWQTRTLEDLYKIAGLTIPRDTENFKDRQNFVL